MNVTQKTKKGFTLVELVIVIAVIAILSAVLIPTFANVVKQANLSSDQVAVQAMNTQLKSEEIANGKPSGATALKDFLKSIGYKDKLSPVTADHRFYWDSQENLIVLVDTADNTVVFPKDGTFVKGDARYVALDGIPEAVVTVLTEEECKNKQLHQQTAGGCTPIGISLNLDTGLKYVAVDETVDESEYANYYADFRVTFSKKLTYDENYQNNITDGMVGFMLIGSYSDEGGYGTYTNIPLAVTAQSGTINADGSQTVRTLKDLMRINFMYSEVVNHVGTFECGIKAVYDNRYSNTFTDYDNQIMDDQDAEYLNGLTVTVELCLFDASGNLAVVCDTYTYTYRVENKTIVS